MSHIAINPMPPAMHAPFTAAIIGMFRRRTRRSRLANARLGSE
jgi:hypothetical protein